VNKFFNFFLVLIILTNCSLNNKSRFWSKSEIVKKENLEVKEVYKQPEIYEKEFNLDLRIKINEQAIKNSFINNLTNNNGTVSFKGSLDNISKYKFSKITNFDQYQPDLLLTQNQTLIFFDDKGSVLNFDQESKLLWKTNVYKKKDQKLKPILYFASNDNVLIIVDNISNYYALNINNGKLIWIKGNPSPFNSQVKIFKDKFFAVDFENILRCFSIKTGEEIWSYKTDQTLIKSQQKLSLTINKKDKNIYFLNSLGDLTSVDMETGNLNWQTPTKSTDIYESSFMLNNSEIINANNSIYFSNNENEFFSIDVKTGVVKWKQNINSNLRPTFSDNLLFTITIEGYLTILDPRNGNILRMTYILDKIKKAKKNKVYPTGFVVSTEEIYVSLNNGKLIIVDMLTGKSKEILKLSSDKISRPYFLNNNLYIVRNNAILKIN
jgi:outer membrane protein assembly factor BamB